MVKKIVKRNKKLKIKVEKIKKLNYTSSEIPLVILKRKKI